MNINYKLLLGVDKIECFNNISSIKLSYFGNKTQPLRMHADAQHLQIIIVNLFPIPRHKFLTRSCRLFFRRAMRRVMKRLQMLYHAGTPGEIG